MANSSTSNPAPIAPFVKSEVADLFAEHGVVLVHCSGDIKGFGSAESNSYDPIERLVKASSGSRDVSCSTIKSGDFLRIEDGTNKKYFGPLGLILDPGCFSNISLSWPSDAGSTFDERTQKRITGFGLGRNSREDVESAITQRGIVQEGHSSATGYNEICCANFKVVGLFADRQKLRFNGVGNELETARTLQDVGMKLPHLPLFFWSPDKACFVRLVFNRLNGDYDGNTAKLVPIGSIYSEPQRF